MSPRMPFTTTPFTLRLGCRFRRQEEVSSRGRCGRGRPPIACGRKFYWPFGGTLLVLCGPEWFRVVFVGFVGIGVGGVNIDLHRRADCGKAAAIGRQAPNFAGGCWNRPSIGWGGPVEGQAPIGPTQAPSRRRGLWRAPYPDAPRPAQHQRSFCHHSLSSCLSMPRRSHFSALLTKGTLV
jgi:hypothetical protein